MLQFTTKEKTELVKFYLKTGSVVKTQRNFKHLFKVRKPPSRNTILNIVNKFYDRGSVENLNKIKSGRKCTKSTTETAETARNAF